MRPWCNDILYSFWCFGGRWGSWSFGGGGLLSWGGFGCMLLVSDADASSCSLADEGYPLKSMGSMSTLAVGECRMVRRSSLFVRGWFVGSGVVMVFG